MKHQEEERKRIARELHDETSQALAAVGMSLEVAVMALNHEELTPKMLTEIHSKVSGLVDGINRIIHNLRPPVLDDLGLEAAIKWLFERQLNSRGIRYSMDTEGLAQVTLEDKTELRLFRIVQEAITNIIRHSRAHFVCFSAKSHSGQLTVNIIDTGIGFDIEKGMNSIGLDGSLEGYGLLGMRERVLHMNGNLEIYSYPNEGTQLHIAIPTSKMEEAYV
jgi:signal transduction histidine kinase